MNFFSPKDRKTNYDRAIPETTTEINSRAKRTEPSRTYWAMNALSTVIACYGLFTNSPAVVIGAMVVAMLF